MLCFLRDDINCCTAECVEERKICMQALLLRRHWAALLLLLLLLPLLSLLRAKRK